MAYPTAVNNQITDSITQANTKVLGDSPAISLGEFFVATSQALANAAHNATTNQQQSGLTSQATNVMGISTLYSLDTASTEVSTTLIQGLHYPARGAA
jgi:hypothetical protein